MMNKRKTEIATLLACLVIWMGTTVAMCLIKHWAIAFVAVAHGLSLLKLFVIIGKSIPNQLKQSKESMDDEFSTHNAQRAIHTSPSEWIH